MNTKFNIDLCYSRVEFDAHASVFYLPFIRCIGILIQFLFINVILNWLWTLDLWVAFPLQNFVCSVFIVHRNLVDSVPCYACYLLFALVSSLSGHFEPARWVLNVKSFINVIFRCLIIDHLWTIHECPMSNTQTHIIRNQLVNQTIFPRLQRILYYVWIKFYVNLIYGLSTGSRWF